MKGICLTIIATLSGMAYGFGSDLKVGDLYYNLLATGDAEVCCPDDGTTYEGDISVPASFQLEGNIIKVVGIGKRAFAASELTNIDLSNSDIEYISEYAFSECNKLIEISKLPSTLRHIDKGAFYNCYNLAQIELNENLTEIPEFAFADCGNLSAISFPAGMQKIASRAFSSCISLQEVIIPEQVKEIGERAFSGCTSIEKLQFECKTAFLGEGAFENASKLPWLYLVGITELGKDAFAHCQSLEWIEIGRGLDEIGGGAFADCPKLQTIYAVSEVPPKITINTFDTETEANANLQVIRGASERYAMAAFWNRFTHIGETLDFPLGIESKEVSPSVRIYAHGNFIVIEGASEEIDIINLDGTHQIIPCSSERINIETTPGTYIVSSGETTVKLIM